MFWNRKGEKSKGAEGKNSVHDCTAFGGGEGGSGSGETGSYSSRLNFLVW